MYATNIHHIFTFNKSFLNPPPWIPQNINTFLAIQSIDANKNTNPQAPLLTNSSRLQRNHHNFRTSLNIYTPQYIYKISILWKNIFLAMNVQLQFLEYINTYFSPWTPECHSIPTNTIFTSLNPIFKLNPSWIFLHEYHKTSILWINIFLNVQLQLLEYIIHFYHEHSECQLIQSSPLILTNSSWILLHKYHKILFSPWIFNYNAPGIYQHLLSPNVTQKYHSTPTFGPPKPYF